jgi:hypothetical protein
MPKKIYFFLIILIIFCSCVKIKEIDLIGKNFLLLAFNKNHAQMQNLIYKSNNTITKDFISYINQNIKYIHNKTLISYHGYRAILVDNEEIHCLWYKIITNNENTPAAIYFLKRNNEWKIFSINIGESPDNW